MKIQSRQPVEKNGGKKFWNKHSNNRVEPVIRRKAWYLQTSVCCEMTHDNMDELRKKLSTCQAVKTTLKLTPQTLSWGRRGYHQRIKRTKIMMDHVQSIEQDEFFVNVLLCILEFDNMPDNIRYQIAAFKFHDTADVRALVGAFQTWTGAGPIEKAPSMVDGSALARSMADGSMHSLTMPGRPTNGSFAPDRWVAVDRPSLRRGMSASMGNLTSPSEVFYSEGIKTATRNGYVQGAGGRSHMNGSAVGYRYNRATPEHQTMTSDEGNGSLTFSDNANHQQWRHQHVTYSEAKTSTRKPVDPDQHNRSYSQNQSNVTGSAVVITGGGGSGGGDSTGLTRSSGIGRESHDFDDLSDDVSTVSRQSSSAFNEPVLTTRTTAHGVATANVS